MVLCIDIGNSTILFGVYSGKKLLRNWKMDTDAGGTAERYAKDIQRRFRQLDIPPSGMDGIVVSCVVPCLEPVIKDAVKQCFGQRALFVSAGLDTPLKITVDKPSCLGADRIATAVAAFEKYGTDAIVVDFGTAVTFDVVSARGEYRGGVIAAGIGILSDALAEKTAKLPRIKLSKPEVIVGKNTVESMKSGIFYGFMGQVKEIISRIKREVGEDAVVIGTGGYAELMDKETGLFDGVEPFLILEGLRIIWERNRERSKNKKKS